MSDTADYTFQSNSSNIESVSFTEPTEAGVTTGELSVTFRSGRTYRYFEVPVEAYRVMQSIEEQTGSCGSHFNKTVRPVYAYEEVV